VEQLETRVVEDGSVATAYLGLVPAEAAVDGEWRPAGEVELPFVGAAQTRLRAKLSYTNLGFALAPATFTISELREVYVAALGHDVSATNLQRVLVRRGVLGTRRRTPRTGPHGRPPRGPLPLRLEPAGGDRRVRRPAPAPLTRGLVQSGRVLPQR